MNNRINMDNIPKHIAIVMDGNGRWAKKRLQPRLFGHRAGMKALHNTVKSASALGIEVLTVYAFSTENWSRSKEEVDGLMKIALEYFLKEIDELHNNDVQVRIIGDLSRLPQSVQIAAQNAMEKTLNNSGLKLCVALNYGGRAEITTAIQNLLQNNIQANEITEDLIGNYLYTSGLPDPDIMLRTGGEKRLSNFLIWQNAYAEFVFIDTLWPDFDELELIEVIKIYQQRDRRFGGVKQ